MALGRIQIAGSKQRPYGRTYWILVSTITLCLFPAFRRDVNAVQVDAYRAQATSRKSSTVDPKKPVSESLTPPFRIGESLNYRLAWAVFATAASVQIGVVEQRNLFGWQTWHFRASVHSQAPARALFEVDDQFDSYTDAATSESHQYEMYLNELGKKDDQVLQLTPVGQLSRGGVASAIVQPGTRDPLGAFYALRGVNWQRTPEFRVPVYDGSDLYQVRAQMEIPKQTVAVDAGKFQATKVSIRLYQHDKEVRGTSFQAWFAHDAARTPVLILAEMPYGNVRVELTAAAR
ncbi:MAG: DUF3108 domain-containing protein [Candidatus Acidiferrales bacterium]